MTRTDLETLARDAGRAGKDFQGFLYDLEDDAAKLASELNNADELPAIEAALTEGLREHFEKAGWISLWTTAPADYDGFGTFKIELAGDLHGKPVRRVLVDPRHIGWQMGRYSSGALAWESDPIKAEEERARRRAQQDDEDRERAERRAAGLVWIREIAPSLLDDDEKLDPELSKRALTWHDAFVERKRRVEEKERARLIAQWNECRAAFKDGCTLVDPGRPSARDSFGYVIPGRDPEVYRNVTTTAYDEIDADRVPVHDENRNFVGSLFMVAKRLKSGELRIAEPTEVFPPLAVVKRINRPYTEVLRVPVGDEKHVWVGWPLFGTGLLVLDDAGHLVRRKAHIDAGQKLWRSARGGGS